MFTGQVGGEKTDMWQHPQTLPTVAGGNLPTFGVMIPQETAIRVSGSINDN